MSRRVRCADRLSVLKEKPGHRSAQRTLQTRTVLTFKVAHPIDVLIPSHTGNTSVVCDDRDIRGVDLASLEVMNSRSVGAEAVALSALSKVGLGGKLQALGFNPKQISAAIGNIIGRMVQPGSELSTHQWLHEHSALGGEKIGRLRQKYPRAAKHYKITTEHDAAGKNAIALHYQRMESEPEPETHPGVYCLRSSHRDWDEAKLWQTYTMLTDLEAVFRSLKSELGMRPVYHQKTHRVEGHIFITLLAYNLVHQIRLTLKDQGINDSWESIRRTLSSQVRTTVSLRGDNGEKIHIRKSSYPNASQQVLLRALELPWNPGKTQKTIVTP